MKALFEIGIVPREVPRSSDLWFLCQLRPTRPAIFTGRDYYIRHYLGKSPFTGQAHAQQRRLLSLILEILISRKVFFV